MIENKVKAMGIVSQGWSVTKEAAPLIEGLSGSVIAPILNNQLSRMDDAQIPYIAHSIVDSAIRNGKLELLEGMVEIDESDLRSLKKLLDMNLPLPSDVEYVVKEEGMEVPDGEA